VTFKDGARTFLLGGPVYGGSDRYAIEQPSGRAYVLSKDLISSLEIGESSLHLLDPRGFEVSRLESVTIEANDKKKTVTRVQTGVEGQQIKTWGDPVTKKADGTIANFIENTNNLRPTEYLPDVKVADLTPVLLLTYKDAGGGKLGTLRLYKREKAGELPANTDLDPANPPKGETEYLIVTEKTRIPALVRKDTAIRTEQDIETVFSDRPASTQPKTDPLGTSPLPPNSPRGAAPGGDPHGDLHDDPHSGLGEDPPKGAAPGGAAPKGSAAPGGVAPKGSAAPGGAAPKGGSGDAPKPGAAPGSAAAPAKMAPPNLPIGLPPGITPNQAPAATQGH
jgi:hypothetical protein